MLVDPNFNNQVLTHANSNNYSSWQVLGHNSKEIFLNEIQLTSSGKGKTYLSRLYSPAIPLPTSWIGRQVTLSAWVYSDNWGTVGGSTYSLCWDLYLSSNLTEASECLTRKYIVKTKSTELASSEIKSDIPLANSKWVRISTTFTLNSSNFPADKWSNAHTYLYASFNLYCDGTYKIRNPKLEFSSEATDYNNIYNPNFVYGSTTPSNPINGTIWFKPI